MLCLYTVLVACRALRSKKVHTWGKKLKKAEQEFTELIAYRIRLGVHCSFAVVGSSSFYTPCKSHLYQKHQIHQWLQHQTWTKPNSLLSHLKLFSSICNFDKLLFSKESLRLRAVLTEAWIFLLIEGVVQTLNSMHADLVIHNLIWLFSFILSGKNEEQKKKASVREWSESSGSPFHHLHSCKDEQAVIDFTNRQIMFLFIETETSGSSKYKWPAAKPHTIGLTRRQEEEPGKRCCCSGSQQRVTSPDSDGSIDYQLQPAFTHRTEVVFFWTVTSGKTSKLSWEWSKK